METQLTQRRLKRRVRPKSELIYQKGAGEARNSLSYLTTNENLGITHVRREPPDFSDERPTVQIPLTWGQAESQVRGPQNEGPRTQRRRLVRPELI